LVQSGSGHCGNAARLFFENARFFLRMGGILKIFFREFEAYVKSSILFEDIFREFRLFLINVRDF
jgi:hypothetical protein